jgi:predicted phosphodiesterase
VGKTFAVCIGDTHFPFTNQRNMKAIYKAIAELQPTYVIQLGDLLDQFTTSRWSPTRNYITPEVEFSRGQAMAATMWKTIQKASPKSKCYQIKGNHDDRAKKKIMSVAPELEHLLDVDSLYQFEGVTTSKDERDGLVLNGILFMHGFRSKLGDHARHAHMPVVCGHTHRGGTAFLRLGAETIWELNCGYTAGGRNAGNCPALSYSKQRHIATTTQGYGVITYIGKALVPMFVPLPNV